MGESRRLSPRSRTWARPSWVGSISVGETATLITYSHCRSGAEVALWRFTGSGHVWPGALFNTAPNSTWLLAGVGRGTVLVNANEAMWQFFRRFELPVDPPATS